MEHYILHKAYISNTRAERMSDTVELSPKEKNMPYMSSKYATFHAAQALFYVLHNPAPTSPIVKQGDRENEVLRTLAEIFKKATPPAVPSRVPVREGVQ